MSFVAVPTCVIVSFANAVPTPSTMPPIHAMPDAITATTPPTIPASRVESASARVMITAPSPRTKARNSIGCGGA